jgi:ribonuclease HI
MSILTIAANSKKESTTGGAGSELRWARPKPRYIKLNVDASFHDDKKAGAAGAVLRDIDGHFIAASCCLIPHVSTPMLAEAIALREELELPSQPNLSRAQAESDSSDVINACNGDERWWSEALAVFCLREANKVAHELARFGFENSLMNPLDFC